MWGQTCICNPNNYLQSNKLTCSTGCLGDEYKQINWNMGIVQCIETCDDKSSSELSFGIINLGASNGFLDICSLT